MEYRAENGVLNTKSIFTYTSTGPTNQMEHLQWNQIFYWSFTIHTAQHKKLAQNKFKWLRIPLYTPVHFSGLYVTIGPNTVSMG